MTIIGDAYIAVKGDTKGFSPSVEKGVLSSVSGLAKKAAVIFGGAFVAREVFSGLKNAFEAGAESSKVMADAEQVIKSTGGAANVTADQMDKLATAISLKTGIDDEAILSSQAMIATFTNVRNEAGKNNDIFNQASAIAVDMGVKFKNGPEAAAVQLGKALNDPIKGITALQRVGVTFTDSQKEQIRAMVESGDVMGAQKLILEELGKEFGGQAEAQANSADKIRVAWGNVQETLGKAIMPAIEAIMPAITLISDSLGEVMGELGAAVGQILEALVPALGPLADALIPVVLAIADTVTLLAPIVGAGIAALVPLLMPIVDLFSRLLVAASPLILIFADLASSLGGSLLLVLTSIFDAVEPLIPVFMSVAGLLAERLGDAIRDLVPVVLDLLDSMVPLIPVVADIARVVGRVLGSVLETLGGTLGELLEALAPVFVTLVEAIGEAAPFFEELVAALMAIVEAALPLLPVIADLAMSLITALAPILPAIAQALTAVAEALVPIMPLIVELVEKMGKEWADALLELSPSLVTLTEALGELLVALVPILPPLIEFLTWFFENIEVKKIQLLVDVVTALAGALEWVADAITSVAEFLQSVTWEEFTDGVAAVADNIELAFQELVDNVEDFLGKLPEKLGEIVEDIKDSAGKVGGAIIDGLGEGLSKTTKFVGNIAGAIKDALVDLVNEIVDKLNSAIPNKLGWGPAAIDLPNDPVPRIKLASGALIRATPGGVPATVAEAGMDEAVVPLPPGLLDGLRMLADGQAGAGGGLNVNVERIDLARSDDPLGNALSMLDELKMAAWLEGIAV